MGTRRIAGGLEEGFRIGVAEGFEEHDGGIGGIFGKRLHHRGAEYGTPPVSWIPKEKERARELRFAAFSTSSFAAILCGGVLLF